MIDVCIVGCGDRGRAHATAWSAHPGVRVTAVSDTDAGRAERLAVETGATAYDSWRDAVASGARVVSQCVPSSMHAEVACYAASHGCHVFAEKPLALTVQQGEQIVSAVRETGVVFMPCFQYRDRWLMRTFREAFTSGMMGSPVVFRHSGVSEVRPKRAMHRMSLNGGPVIDLACHYFDVFRWITGAEPVRVYASGHVFGGNKPHLAGIEDLAVDEACVEVAFEGGHHLQLYLNWGMPEGFASVGDNQLIGPDGLLRQVDEGLEIRSGDRIRLIQAPDDQPAELATRTERFLQAVHHREPVDVTCQDGLIALRVSLAALTSIASGEAVALTCYADTEQA